MKLSGSDKKDLYEALMDAFPDSNDLELVMQFHLEQSIKTIVKEGNLKAIILEIINWAESNDRLYDLIKGAYKENPSNLRLKALYPKYFPFFIEIAVILSSTQWEEIQSLLVSIGYDILQKTCQETLAYVENLEEKVPQILSIKDLNILREILLEKYPCRKDNVPTILEFVERLINCKKVTAKEKLKKWLSAIASEKNITLPVYTEPEPLDVNPDPYLMIKAEKISKGFILETELILDYQEGNQSDDCVQISLDSDHSIHCSESDLKDCIKILIDKAKVKLIEKYKHTNYDLTIELFLPFKYLGKSFDLDKIPADQDRLRPIGYQYPFAVRSLDRYLISFETDTGQYSRKLNKKWEFYRQNKNQDTVGRSILCLDSIEDGCNWDKLSTDWSRNNKLAVNVAGGLPHQEEMQQEFFLGLLRGGVPFSLWNRCPELACKDDIKEQINSLITLDCFKDLRNLFKKVWDLRIDAHDEGETAAKDYLGYHLGFLCDHPDRIPSFLTIDAQFYVGND